MSNSLDIMFGSDDDTQNIDTLNIVQLIEQRPYENDVISFKNGTEESLFLFIEKHSEKGNYANILKTIDNFCWSRNWMMHLGDQKSKYLTDSIQLAKNTNRNISNNIMCLEIGSYCGYSTVTIAKDLNEGSKLISVEINESCVNWTKRLVEFAGLSDRVIVIHGSINNPMTMNQIRANILNEDKKFDLIFIDHDKNLYLKDLLIIESAQLLKSGCVVVADNIMTFGNNNTQYLNHVKDPLGPFKESKTYESFIEYAVPITTEEDTNEKIISDAVKRVQKYKQDIKSLIDGIEISIYK